MGNGDPKLLERFVGWLSSIKPPTWEALEALVYAALVLKFMQHGRDTYHTIQTIDVLKEVAQLTALSFLAGMARNAMMGTYRAVQYLRNNGLRASVSRLSERVREPFKNPQGFFAGKLEGVGYNLANSLLTAVLTFAFMHPWRKFAEIPSLAYKPANWLFSYIPQVKNYAPAALEYLKNLIPPYYGSAIVDEVAFLFNRWDWKEFARRAVETLSYPIKFPYSLILSAVKGVYSIVKAAGEHVK